MSRNNGQAKDGETPGGQPPTPFLRRLLRRRLLLGSAVAGATTALLRLTTSRSASTAASLPPTASPSPQPGDDAWHEQKKKLTTAEEFNSWLTAVALALSEHLKKLGNSGPEQNLRAAIEKFLEALPGLQATKDNLDEKKDLADVLLRPIEVIKAAARLLVTGAALLGAALETILDALAGKVDEVPFNLINKLLDFLIAQQEALGNEEMAKKLRAIKQIKESVEEAAEKVNRLKKAIKELQEELKKK